MAYIWGFLSTLASTALALLLLWLLDFQLYSMSVLVFIPAGAVAFGFLSSIGLFLGIRKTSIVTAKHYFIGALFGLLGFFFIYYGEYQMAYVSDNNQLNYDFNGEHISNYALDDSNVPVNFFSYLSFTLEGSILSLRGSSTTLDLDGDATKFRFLLQIIGFIIGSICTAPILTSEKNKCTACKKSYLKEFELFHTDSDRYIETIDKIEDLILANDTKGFIDYIIQERLVMEEIFTENVKVSMVLSECPNCKDTKFFCKVFVKDREGQYQEAKERRLTYQVEKALFEGVFKTVKVS
ncbi:hypothetical protein P9D43_25920 [Neobacillus niacini]|uniref:hypothetical protein n=1 Tax=Neobacillus niacini TaxID=86668 RepID=UPI0007AB6C25|nr:hypothetical protein [Neobacillus niacini]MEC1525440.1 hypothetical protein [Neobacillus niacini]